MRVFITGTSFAKNVALLSELLARGVDARCVDWGKTFHGEPAPDDRWIVLAPQELPPFAPLPKGDFGQVDAEAPLAEQVDLVLKELHWTPC